MAFVALVPLALWPFLKSLFASQPKLGFIHIMDNGEVILKCKDVRNSGLYYKSITIVNDDARVVIYDGHMCITRDTGPFPTSSLYYKHVTIINYASSNIDKLKASLNDDARVVIYNRHMFIVQATG